MQHTRTWIWLAKSVRESQALFQCVWALGRHRAVICALKSYHDVKSEISRKCCDQNLMQPLRQGTLVLLGLGAGTILTPGGTTAKTTRSNTPFGRLKAGAQGSAPGCKMQGWGSVTEFQALSGSHCHIKELAVSRSLQLFHVCACIPGMCFERNKAVNMSIYDLRSEF